LLSGDYTGGDLHWAAGASFVGPFPGRPDWPVKSHVFLNAGRMTRFDESEYRGPFEGGRQCLDGLIDVGSWSRQITGKHFWAAFDSTLSYCGSGTDVPALTRENRGEHWSTAGNARTRGWSKRFTIWSRTHFPVEASVANRQAGTQESHRIGWLLLCP
jgi:hypothetical protein